MSLSYLHLVTKNKEYISKSKYCACIYCQKHFDAKKVTRYTQYPSTSGLCPYCSIDTVVPDIHGEIKETDLKNWYQEGFG